MEVLDSLVYVAFPTVLVLVGLYFGLRSLFQRGGSIDSASSSLDVLSRAVFAAREIVAGVEQLWQTGQLAEDARLDTAYAILKEQFPSLSPRTLRVLIEAGVFSMKAIFAQTQEREAD